MVLGIPPGLFLILGALLVPLFPGRWRKPYILFLPLAGPVSYTHLRAHET